MATGTDRKQSKALLKLGIPVQTADMHHAWHWDSIVESKKVWGLIPLGAAIAVTEDYNPYKQN